MSAFTNIFGQLQVDKEKFGRVVSKTCLKNDAEFHEYLTIISEKQNCRLI